MIIKCFDTFDACSLLQEIVKNTSEKQQNSYMVCRKYAIQNSVIFGVVNNVKV